jgi:hypothetical protein
MADLTVIDLAARFDRRVSTVRGWLGRGCSRARTGFRAGNGAYQRPHWIEERRE